MLVWALFLLLAPLAQAKSPSVTPTFSPSPSPSSKPCIVFGNAWLYNDKNPSLTDDWRNITFDDSLWLSGFTPAGYGFSDTNTSVKYGAASSNRFITTYFRNKVNITRAKGNGNKGNLTFNAADGVVVYANGYLVGSWNMPEGLAVTPSLLASSAITTLAVSNTVRSLVIPDQFILNGANVIAVEVHKGTLGSKYLKWNAQLWMSVDPPQSPTSTASRTPSKSSSLTRLYTYSNTPLPSEGAEVVVVAPESPSSEPEASPSRQAASPSRQAASSSPVPAVVESQPASTSAAPPATSSAPATTAAPASPVPQASSSPSHSKACVCGCTTLTLACCGSALSGMEAQCNSTNTKTVNAAGGPLTHSAVVAIGSVVAILSVAGVAGGVFMYRRHTVLLRNGSTSGKGVGALKRKLPKHSSSDSVAADSPAPATAEKQPLTSPKRVVLKQLPAHLQGRVRPLTPEQVAALQAKGILPRVLSASQLQSSPRVGMGLLRGSGSPRDSPTHKRVSAAGSQAAAVAVAGAGGGGGGGAKAPARASPRPADGKVKQVGAAAAAGAKGAEGWKGGVARPRNEPEGEYFC